MPSSPVRKLWLHASKRSLKLRRQKPRRIAGTNLSLQKYEPVVLKLAWQRPLNKSWMGPIHRPPIEAKTNDFGMQVIVLCCHMMCSEAKARV